MRRTSLKVLLIFVLGFGLTLVLFASTNMGTALFKSRSHFSELAPGLFYESGMEAEAQQVLAWLPDSVARIEKHHGTPFRSPVKIFICSTWTSFNQFTSANPEGRARGATFGKSVFLSHEFGRLGNPQDLLEHELSHLHLKQYLGLSSLWRVPEWFEEGLAVAISGAGAERMTEAEATEAILAGQSLTLHAQGRFPQPRRASDYGLTHVLFYRQSTMFVEYLQSKDAVAFSAFLQGIIKKGNFAKTFQKHFHMDLEQAWQQFTTSLEHPLQ